MRTTKLCCLLLALAVLALSSPVPAQAATAYVKHQNLTEMCDEAAMIYRGKVLSITTGTVELGGGELPTLTFKLEVTESFKGEYTQKGDKYYAELTVPGSFKPVTKRVGDYENRLILPDPPALRVGEEYLLLTNAPNEHGLSNTIGLAQGCFHISGSTKGEVVMNGANNTGLFNGMPEQGLAAAGSISYAEIAQIIRDGLGQ